MATESAEILHDFSPMIRVYKNGKIERLEGLEVTPPSTDPETGVQSKDVEISLEIGSSARLYLPKDANPGRKLLVLVYFHGGGFAIQSAFSGTYHDHLNRLAARANCIVVSAEYRLAPEHPVPIAHEDCWVALKWVCSHSKGGGNEVWLKDYADFDHVFLGGDSAGGNLAHHMAMRAGEGKLEGINLEGIFLNCPYFWGNDPIGNESVIKNYVDNLWFFTCNNSMGLDDPLLNPAMDPKLSSLGCRKVLVFVAEKDGLKHRGWFYKETVIKSGWKGEIEVVEFPGEDHVFNLFKPTCDNALAMLDKLASFMNPNKIP